MQVGSLKEEELFIHLKVKYYISKKMYKCLRRERALIALLLFLLLVILILDFILLPSQLIINLHVLDVQLEMKAPNLLLA